MPCTTELRNLPVEEVRVQEEEEGGTREAGGSRVGSSSSSSSNLSSSSSSNNSSSYVSSPSSGSSSISKASRTGGGKGGATPEGVTGPQWRWDATACKYRWDDSGPNPFGRGGQVPAMSWVPTDPPPGASRR